ncbi:MAG: hypothetical protein ACPIOQ_51900, partial [Promethearchaeia archaeon]
NVRRRGRGGVAGRRRREQERPKMLKAIRWLSLSHLHCSRMGLRVSPLGGRWGAAGAMGLWRCDRS